MSGCGCLSSWMRVPCECQGALPMCHGTWLGADVFPSEWVRIKVYRECVWVRVPFLLNVCAVCVCVMGPVTRTKWSMSNADLRNWEVTQRLIFTWFQSFCRYQSMLKNPSYLAPEAANLSIYQMKSFFIKSCDREFPDARPVRVWVCGT